MYRYIRVSLIFLRQMSLVFVGFLLLFLFFQCSLTPSAHDSYLIRIEGTGTSGKWTYEVSTFYHLKRIDQPNPKVYDAVGTFENYRTVLGTALKGSKIVATGIDPSYQKLELTVDVLGNEHYQIDAQTITLDQLEERIANLGLSRSLAPARQVTVQDVLDAKVPTPTRSRVSFPNFSYQQAFPENHDDAEYTITQFNQAPLLKDRTILNPDNPEYLPQVEQRLPRNPAVVWGPDGVGVYGGDFNQCASSYSHLTTKLGTESFTRFDPSGNIQPCLAYKWEVSEDNRIFTFYLRKGHKWSDGHPFTAQDILYVCNVDIGSQRWMEVPDWMQPTDGSTSFSVLDINNWDDLRTFLNSEDTLAQHLQSLFKKHDVSLNDLFQLRDYQDLFISMLNKICNDSDFYQKEQWPTLDFERELNQLNQVGFSQLNKQERGLYQHLTWRNALFADLQNSEKPVLETTERVALNVMLLRLAKADLFRQPFKQQVITEAVADEAGDNTHIVRFTFPRPNPLFIERTATFMFYRGLFGMPKHRYADYHYNGNHKLQYFDILRWPTFIENLVEDGKSDADNALKRLWTLIPESDQNLIAQYKEPIDPSPQAANADQLEIIRILNQALAQRSFYEQSLWPAEIFERYRFPIKDKSIRDYQFEDWNRFKEYHSVKSLKQRVDSSDSSALSQEELENFNTLLLRLCFEPRVVAENREKALTINASIQRKQYKTWVARLRDFDKYHPDTNPHMPILNAWRIVSQNLERNIIAVRNPYYYRVDVEGNQLPYLDRIVVQKEARESVRELKLASGNVDFQTRQIDPSDWAILKSNEFGGKYRVFRWANDYCGELNFYTLQTNKDPIIGPVIRDKKFRYALSHALNRQEMIDVFWQGLGSPAQCAVPKGSPFYSEAHAQNKVTYDIDEANRLLDELGLHKRGADGTRLLTNGEPLIIYIHSSLPQLSKVMQMACNYWQAVGINARLKEATVSAINNRLGVGTLEIGVRDLGDSYFGPLLPGNYAPSHPAECQQWHSWALWYMSSGHGGIEPPPEFKARKTVWDKIIFAESKADVLKYWFELQDLTANELPNFGVTTSPGQVVYVKDGFKNVPKLALSGWIAHQPGNCCPEVFYKEKWAQ